MLKKSVTTLALCLGILGGAFGATAHADLHDGGGGGGMERGPDIAAGVYPNLPACISAGVGGTAQGRWSEFDCTQHPTGQFQLWIKV